MGTGRTVQNRTCRRCRGSGQTVTGGACVCSGGATPETLRQRAAELRAQSYALIAEAEAAEGSRVGEGWEPHGDRPGHVRQYGDTIASTGFENGMWYASVEAADGSWRMESPDSHSTEQEAMSASYGLVYQAGRSPATVAASVDAVPAGTPEWYERIVTSGSDTEKQQLGRDDSTPREYVGRLISGTNDDVRRYIATRRDLAPEQYDALADKGGRYTFRRLAANPSVTPYAAQKVADGATRDGRALRSLLRNPGVPDEIKSYVTIRGNIPRPSAH